MRRVMHSHNMPCLGWHKFAVTYRQGDDATILGANTIWILVIAGWVGGMMFPFFYLLKALNLLRVSEKEELVCADPASALDSGFSQPSSVSREFSAGNSDLISQSSEMVSE